LSFEEGRLLHFRIQVDRVRILAEEIHVFLRCSRTLAYNMFHSIPRDRGARNTGPPSSSHLLSVSGNLSCSDRRDHIFGLLALLKDSHAYGVRGSTKRPTFQPNYTWTSLQLLFEFVKAYAPIDSVVIRSDIEELFNVRLPLNDLQDLTAYLPSREYYSASLGRRFALTVPVSPQNYESMELEASDKFPSVYNMILRYLTTYGSNWT
jgi:hypothetical protein